VAGELKKSSFFLTNRPPHVTVFQNYQRARLGLRR
jgi:hypothetical protein